jgi:hypothetical protein
MDLNHRPPDTEPGREKHISRFGGVAYSRNPLPLHVLQVNLS